MTHRSDRHDPQDPEDRAGDPTPAILARIERETGVAGLVELLAERLAPTDLRTLLLEVARRRAERRTPAEVLRDWERDRFVRPGTATPERLLAWERTLLAALPAEVEALALSPVCPLGTCSAVAAVDQNRTVATVRLSEVVADLTNVLALEAAVRRRDGRRASGRAAPAVHLAASARLLRGQRFEGAGQVPHFALFGLVGAGRARAGLGFETAALRLQLGVHLRALRAFLPPATPLRLTLTDLSGGARRAELETELLAPLGAAHPDVATGFDDAREGGRGYYRDVGFHVHADAPDGARLLLVDGGAVDWTARLLSDAKERLVISGVGSERVATAFGAALPGRGG